MSGLSTALRSLSRAARLGGSWTRRGPTLQSRPLAFSLICVALFGCQEPDLPEVVWRGEIIDFAATSLDGVCGESLAWSDARAAALQAVFAPATRERIDYFWIPDIWEDHAWCSAGNGACTINERILTPSVPDEHEMVHAIRRERLPAVFEEGLASMFGDIGWARYPASRERLLEILDSSDPVDFADYARAGHFVSFLIERDGLDALAELASMSSYDDSIARVRESFEQVYGVSLAQVLDEYANYPECVDLAWKDRRIACSGEATDLLEPALGADAQFVQELECGQAHVLGPSGDLMFTETLLDIEPGLQNFPLHLSLIGDIDGEVSAALVSCDGGCGDATAIWLYPSSFEQPILPPGRYLLRLFRRVDDPGELGISLTF